MGSMLNVKPDMRIPELGNSLIVMCNFLEDILQSLRLHPEGLNLN